MIFNLSVLNIKQMVVVTLQRVQESFCSTSVCNSQGRWENSFQVLSRSASSIVPAGKQEVCGLGTVVCPQPPVSHSLLEWEIISSYLAVFSGLLFPECALLFSNIYCPKCPTEVSLLTVTLWEYMSLLSFEPVSCWFVWYLLICLLEEKVSGSLLTFLKYFMILWTSVVFFSSYSFTDWSVLVLVFINSVTSYTK